MTASSADRVPQDAQAASVSTAGPAAVAAGPAARARGTRSSPARPGRLRRSQLWYLGALIVVLDAAIVGPLIGRGSLHLLDVGDYPQSPHPAFVPSASGFPPGVPSRAPVEAVMYWLFQGIHWSPVYLLPFAALAPLACAGFSRLLPGRAVAIGTATALFTVNPFIYERMASGQMYVLMGYSLLPAILALAVRPLRSLVGTAALGGLIFAVSVALSVHYLFIGLLVLATVVLAHLVLRQKRAVQAGAGIAGCGLALSMYWLIPAMRATRTMPSHVTSLDLSAFRTLSDPVWGLAVNIAGLYGFWRPGPPLVKSHLSGWPFLLLAVLVVVALGLYDMWRRGPAGRALALSCSVLAIAGGLLAAGAQGVAAGLYLWLFEHLPGFKVMREAEKFSALVALGYAVGFGTGTEAIVAPLTRRASKAVCVFCAAAIPLAYGYTELWGFDGYARPSAAPVSWAAADRAMAPGATALALPWRAYFQVPWFGNRVVANPVQGYFDRPVISADDTEAGSITTETSNPRSLFLQFCLSEGRPAHRVRPDPGSAGNPLRDPRQGARGAELRVAQPAARHAAGLRGGHHRRLREHGGRPRRVRAGPAHRAAGLGPGSRAGAARLPHRLPDPGPPRPSRAAERTRGYRHPAARGARTYPGCRRDRGVRAGACAGRSQDGRAHQSRVRRLAAGRVSHHNAVRRDGGVHETGKTRPAGAADRDLRAGAAHPGV